MKMKPKKSNSLLDLTFNILKLITVLLCCGFFVRITWGIFSDYISYHSMVVKYTDHLPNGEVYPPVIVVCSKQSFKVCGLVL